MAGDPERRARLLVLGAGPAQLGLLAAARERGLWVIAADRDASAPGFSLADRRALVSTEDEVALERLAVAEEVDGIVSPGSDWPVAIAARIADRLGLPHPVAPDTAVLATSKLRQRERLAECGVPQPAWLLCRDPADARDAAAELGYPCVVKAPDRQGQRGLALVAGPEDVERAAAAALEASRGGLCLVEEHAPGREVTVNAFSVAGRFHPLTVTDRLVAAPPAFGVALAHAWPSEQPDAAVAAAVRAAEAAAEALGVEEGPTYTQVLASPAGPRVVELAARLGGGHDAELCREALGVDLAALAVAAALGEPVDEAPLRPAVTAGGACVRFLVPPEGALGSTEGLDDARAAEGVRLVHAYRRPPWEFGPLRRGADRAGAVLAVGDSRDEALARADAAAALVRFVPAGTAAPDPSL